MTWYENIEQKRNLLVSGIIAICIAALAVTARRNPISFDSYWHLQTGLDWLNKGLSPWVDHFSFTYSGQPLGGPFLFQSLLAWLVNNFGLESGYVIFKFSSFMLAFGLITLFLKKLRSPAIIYLMVLPLFVLLIQLRSTVRPELISYSFLIVAVMLYHRAQGRISASNVLPMCFLMILWANYHSPILGYITLFGFFVDAAVLQIREKANTQTWIEWLIWGVILLGVGFLHRGFSHAIIGAFTFAPEWKGYIQEYHSAAIYSDVKAIYALLILTVATMYLAVKQQKIGYLIVTVIFAYYSVKMARLVTPCGIAILTIFASLVSNLDIKKSIQNGAIFNWSIGLGVCFISVASLYSSVNYARLFMAENRTSATIRPELVVEYMKENQIRGRVFNDFGIGGYLIYALSPEVQVYIDGRSNILYPLRHYKRFLEARNNPGALREEIEKYDINLAILNSDQRAYSVMFEAGELGLDYVDRRYSLFRRDNPKFPLIGKLLGNPTCWNSSDLEALESEYTEAIWNLPVNSSLLPVVGLMFNFSQAADQRKFLSDFEKSSSQNALQLRFAANRTLDLGQYQISVNLFQRIPVWDLRERLSAAIAYTHLSDWQNAESIVDGLTTIKWPSVTVVDMVLQYRILETIKQNGTLNIITENYVANLKEQVELMGYSTTELDLDLDLLCKKYD